MSQNAFTGAAFSKEEYCRLRGRRAKQDLERTSHSRIRRLQFDSRIQETDLLLQVVDF